MLTAFAPGLHAPQQLAETTDPAILRGAIWIDLLNPTEAEIQAVQQATGLELPTEAELAEIESSSRIYTEAGALYLSMPLVTQAETDPRSSSIGFVLSRTHLVSMRFMPSRLFDSFIERLPRAEMADQTGARILVGLLEAVVDRLADVMEKIRNELDDISHAIFRPKPGRKARAEIEDREQREVLQTVGRAGDLVSRIRDSLLGVGRIVPYLRETAEAFLPPDLRTRLRTLRQDISSLNDYDGHLTGKVHFLLDATLGFISIAQNNIMKVFTVFSVAGIPPVLIAGIYGMNFKNIPEYDWPLGYLYALLAILVSAVLPLLWFRRKGWL